MADLSVFQRIRSKDDFDRERAEFDLRKQLAQAQVMQAQKMGAGPAAVQEWQYYNNLPQEDQSRYLQMKRADQIMNLGGQMAVRSPLGGVQESYQVTPEPEQMPGFKRAVSEQEAIGRLSQELTFGPGIEKEKVSARLSAEQGASDIKKGRQSQSILSTIKEAETLLPIASGGLGGTALSAGKGIINYSDETTQANEKLRLLSGWLVSNVPRMEGPQSNFDVQNYKTMAADVGNTMKPIGDRMAALRGLQGLQEKYSEINMAPTGIQPITADDLNAPYPKQNGLTPPAGPNQTKLDVDETLFNARKALKNGGDKNAIRARLIENGIDPSKAGL